MEAFLYTLAGFAILGLFWLAYNHPPQYRRLHIWVLNVSGTAMVLYGLFSLGVQRGVFKTFDFVKDPKDAAGNSLSSIDIVDKITPVPVFTTVVVYLLLLGGSKALLLLDGMKTGVKSADAPAPPPVPPPTPPTPPA